MFLPVDFKAIRIINTSLSVVRCCCRWSWCHFLLQESRPESISRPLLRLMCKLKGEMCLTRLQCWVRERFTFVFCVMRKRQRFSKCAHFIFIFCLWGRNQSNSIWFKLDLFWKSINKSRGGESWILWRVCVFRWFEDEDTSCSLMGNYFSVIVQMSKSLSHSWPPGCPYVR